MRSGGKQDDFLLESKAKNWRVLDFLSEEEAQRREKILNSAKTINLRDGQPKFLPEEAPLRKQRGRPKKNIQTPSERPAEAALSVKNFVSGQPVILEGLEISYPDREEILAVLEAIEKNNLYLQEFGLGAEDTEAEIQKMPELAGETGYNFNEQSSAVFPPDDFVKYQPKIIDWEEPEISLWEEPEENNFIQASVMELNEEAIEILDDLEIKEEQEPPAYRTGRPVRSNQWLKKATNFFSRPRSTAADLSDKASVPENFKKRFSAAALRQLKPDFPRKRKIWRGAGFASAGFVIWLVIFGLSLAGQGLSAKGNILSSALQAYKAMLAAKDSATRLDFSGASVNFEEAYQNFLQADQELNKMGRSLIYVLEKLPGGSVVGSGAALVTVGENLAKAGNSFAKIASVFISQNLDGSFASGGESITKKIFETQQEINAAQSALATANTSLNRVNSADLPADMREEIDSLKQKLPIINQAASQLKNWSNVFLAALGQEKSKKYLLIFQNNSEIRPTGGFIGTYGLLDIDKGEIKNLFIDGIFNLDGQLYEKIIPPKPIQKISTAWSTHDANWFADFPASARKIMSFYEKAGGMTVDGIISLTPAVIERLLAVTGPIDMPEFGVSLNSENFMDVIQYKVEVDYDKGLNQPKKILADFAPKFMDKLVEVLPQNSRQILDVISGVLQEKQILFYFSDPALEKAFSEQGWAGQILETDKDYLSVVNTNINGFKTDKVIEQKIYHQSQIQADGSIVDTVKITRRHQGGSSQYDWYNKVNSDYLRIYVPLGSQLISAQGQTPEVYSEPIDYAGSGFKADPEIKAQEDNTAIDKNSGTQIFSESGKTVFGNWVYVSPGETTEITYEYLLPFKLNLSADNFSWSLLAQKQSGSISSQFESTVVLPQEFRASWRYPADLQIFNSQIKFSGDLKTDEFFGAVLTK